MKRKQIVQWSDVADLRVVGAMTSLLDEHYGLIAELVPLSGEPLRLVPARREGTDEARAEERPQPAKAHWCAGSYGCAAEASTGELVALERTLGSSAAHASQDGQPGEARAAAPRRFQGRCGLTQLRIPIASEQTVHGHLVVGCYARSEADRLGHAAWAAGSADGARAGAPPARILDAQDEAHAAAISCAIVEEIERFQDELGAMERRLAERIEQSPLTSRYGDIIGRSPVMVELYGLLDKVAASDTTVLVQGENGTGKELIARAIHFNSARRARRFVVQNCSAFNDNLLDSELFGHRKGSFTGAIADKAGMFEVADGSTFFLDEIGDMSPTLQVKLLRVLQEGTFIPVGDTQVRHVDVRIIAATNRDLQQMVERGEFREDLYYRINVINIRVPPLRERREDIAFLVDHFLQKQSKGNPKLLRRLSKACYNRLMEYRWPGNVRELENEIERMVVLAGPERLVGEDALSARIREPAPPRDSAQAAPEGQGLPEAIEHLERSMIYDTLKRHHWNKTRAAEVLRISRRNLIRKVNKYNLDQRRVR